MSEVNKSTYTLNITLIKLKSKISISTFIDRQFVKMRDDYACE